MKTFIVAIFAVVSMSGAIAQANEVASFEDMQQAFVVEPTAHRCSTGYRMIAKYCWDAFRGCHVKCGFVCMPERPLPEDPTPN
ncbi:hypothetical protein ACES2L_05045 [Bdellovibrio bacteriovorus]